MCRKDGICNLYAKTSKVLGLALITITIALVTLLFLPLCPFVLIFTLHSQAFAHFMYPALKDVNLQNRLLDKRKY